MILKALYDYYNRCGNLPMPGMEEKEIGFLLVISKEGKFIRFEDCRIDKSHARSYLVKRHVIRSSAPVPNYLYDNSAYVFGYSDKGNGKEQLYFDTFKQKVASIQEVYPDSMDLQALVQFYNQGKDKILEKVAKDPLWKDITKNLTKKYSTFSFRIEGDTKILAEKKELLQLDGNADNTVVSKHICLITGEYGIPVETTTATMIPGSQATAKLVAFQCHSGYDSYGKMKCGNAPISEEAEFAYTTALNALLQKDSRNKFSVGTRTFVFWASTQNEAAEQAEESLFDMLGFSDEELDDPNAKIEQVRKVFHSIYSGTLKTNLYDKFYILGLAPNSARIAVVYWSETPLREFAGKILRHFQDMEIVDTRKVPRPYTGVKHMLAAVTLNEKKNAPNLPEAVISSVFQATPYPFTLFSACIRRIRAESGDKDKNAIRIARMAILKAYLNRTNDNNKKIEIMLDESNTNLGYLCGRLFAVLDKVQEAANGINTIRERYMNAASATPSSVFATILNLSSHHMEKLSAGQKVFYEKIKQEIISKIPSDGFPAHLDLQDQGRFFIGYYHQRQDFFTKKEEKNEDKE